MRRFRATLFQIEKDGPEGKRWGQSADVIAAVHGYAAFVCMVDPARGKALRKRTAALVKKHGTKPTPPPTTGGSGGAATPAAEADAPKKKKKKKWWKLF